MSNERDSALSYLEAGNEYLLRKDWPSATQAFRTAVRLDPQLPKAHAGLGAALGNQGLWQLASEAHRVACSATSDVPRAQPAPPTPSGWTADENLIQHGI